MTAFWHTELRQSMAWFLALVLALLCILALPLHQALLVLSHYPPLHMAMEMTSIAISLMVFGIAWSAQKYQATRWSLVLGLGLLGAALLDVSHALSYAGMPDYITPSGPEKAINFWLAGRSLVALVLLWAAFWPSRWNAWLEQHWPPLLTLAIVLLGVALAHFVLLLRPQWLPRTFIPGTGLTPFKIGFEHALICAYLAAAWGLLLRLRKFHETGLSYLVLAALTLAMSEFCLTLYSSVSDLYNMAGHLYKIAAYGFLYRGLFVETVQRPYRELQAVEARQRATLAAVPDLLLEIDPQGRYLAIHSDPSAHLISPANDLLGRHLSKELPPAAAEQALQALAEAGRNGISRGRRIQLELAGVEHHFELSVAQKPGTDEQPGSFLVLSRDVTASVQHEQHLQLQARLNACLLALRTRPVQETETDFLRWCAAQARELTGSPMAVLHFATDALQGSLPAVCADPSCPTPGNVDGHSPACLADCWRQALAEGQPLRLNQLPQQAQYAGLQRIISMPVLQGGQTRMLLGVGNKPRPYSEQDEQALRLLAGAIWERALQRRQETLIRRLSDALDQNPHPVLITDIRSRIEYVNPAFCAVSGYSAQEVLGCNPRMLQSGLTPKEVHADMWASLGQGRPWQGEVVNRRKNGQAYTQSVSIYPTRDASGQFTHYVAHLEDVTQRRAAQEHIRHLSRFDGLTGLLNKATFDEHLIQALVEADARDEPVSLLWLNLDNFKLINETLGHAGGDALLLAVAQRLREQLGPQVPLARYSGNTFSAIWPRSTQGTVALMVSELLQHVQQPFSIDHQSLVISASAGIAVYPADAPSASTLASAAELAMYRAKQDGRNTLRFFAPDMQAHTQRSLQLAAGLKMAAQQGELFLVFQPQCTLGQGRISGAEALLRWRHPQLGLVSPGEFIPLAEQTGAILAIDFWVVEQAALQLRAWDEAGLPPLVLAVNVSAAQFGRALFVPELLHILQRVGLAPQRIEIELTEAVALKNPEQAVATIAALHAAGFHVALDDFGTGYSSMSYLKRYAIDKLKIDQSFVRELTAQSRDQAIVTAIVKLAHSLGLRTLAEGVETAEQAALLQACGCAQGYWYSRPLEPAAFEAFVRQQLGKYEQKGLLPASGNGGSYLFNSKTGW